MSVICGVVWICPARYGYVDAIKVFVCAMNSQFPPADLRLVLPVTEPHTHTRTRVSVWQQGKRKDTHARQKKLLSSFIILQFKNYMRFDNWFVCALACGVTLRL